MPKLLSTKISRRLSATQQLHTKVRIAVYHYVIKSRQEYEEKMLRGAGDRSHKDVAFFEDVEAAAVDECWDAVNWSRQRMSNFHT